MPLLLRLTVHVCSLCSIYQGLRLGFYLTNRSQYLHAHWNDLGFAFLHGLRFDLATIASSNLLFYLLSLLPSPKAWQTIKSWTLTLSATIINFVCIGINLADIEYFKFTGKRFTRDVLAISQDLSQQLGPLAVYYWYITGLLLLMLWLLFRFHLWVFRTENPRLLSPQKKVSTAALCLIWILSVGIAARGGVQAKPLIPAHAFLAASPSLGVLTLNSAFSFYKSSTKDGLRELPFFSEKELREEIDSPRGRLLPTVPPPPKNVVIIVLESFGMEYVRPPDGRPSFAPYVSQLMEKGSSFPQAYANGRRSIDMLPSIFAGLPSWMGPPFITSPYQTNQLRGLPSILAEAGFQTSFYHGGNNGTMFFDVLARNLGFQRYIGEQEYPSSGDHDGQWGIFDEPFLQFVVDDLSQKKGPFFAGIFTLTSHNPYRIPDNYKGRFPKGTLEIHESIGYADYALAKFFEKARTKDWYKDTLFVITADHTSKSEHPLYETSYGLFSVPILFLQNDHALPFPDHQRITQHIDIFPTLLDHLRLTGPPIPPFGQSLWRTENRPGLVLFDAETYILLGQQELIRTDLQTRTHGYRWREDPLLATPLPLTSVQAQALQFLKAQVQFYHQGMIRNRLLYRSQAESDP